MKKDSLPIHCGIVILAAGSSSRLGRPKQSLHYQGKSLLQHTVDTAIASQADKVVVVLGAYNDPLQQELQNEKIVFVVNRKWQEGIASSIRCGLEALLKEAALVEGAVFMACDQPFVSTELINQLLVKYLETGKSIVASHYEDIFGIPAFFNRNLFRQLLTLQGDVGARKIMMQYMEHTTTVTFPKGEIDIDTPADYMSLQDR